MNEAFGEHPVRVSSLGGGWSAPAEMEREARDAGCAGVVLMGLRFDSLVKEAPAAWARL